MQNRSFEYSPAEKRDWNPLSYWEYISPGYSYGKISVETVAPINASNPHYIVLQAEHIGKEAKFTGESGVGIKNTGFAGMVIQAGEKYNLSFFARQLSGVPIALNISLQNTKGEILAEASISTASANWQKYTAVLPAMQSFDTASLVILAKSTGRFALDVVSLFPEKARDNFGKTPLATRPGGART